MLIEFKSDYDKIAMGLLSYTADLKETSRLTEELDMYKNDDSRQLFLWRSEETDDLCAVLGIEEEEDVILLRHLSVNPSYRGEGLTYRMLDQLSDRYEHKTLMGTLESGSFVKKWQKRRNQQEALQQEIEDTATE
ncbi:N-acetyltransferase [Dolosigranulum pigrum]|jgi:riboflavin biosynthesis RibT protein|uniref:N-acetyltransferase domain-containing protein n=3 Tax=Dolosigranulum TaxID=29393 RepID=H3NDY9_9LACT|nr:GNAT family N-acetyltransferase [Dolosigranulum pigrum]EHR33716.1 hypothetical protein HMPREF9703_00770 [Dolosigranulum pigrum ATCC 51524]OOL81107.1 N-acetyltransferase [Dolosigranulum pigrum]QJS96225.1 N-acetyltransferase [Dolosigranulum pigrum]QTJ36609.1 N-acetyltransferase [Dolosigranulum pigrum]QTJ41766.1 N-acetyltransferase [Dolosigranulum pigrum]